MLQGTCEARLNTDPMRQGTKSAAEIEYVCNPYADWGTFHVVTISHQLIDQRCLALHRAVSDRIRRRPDMLAVARENLRRWAEMNGFLSPALEEWREILDTRTPEEILRLLCDPGDEATRLRQSSPFGGVLSEPERLRILKQYEPRAA